MNCIVFVTHNFGKEFVNALDKIDTDPNIGKYKVLVLCDASANISSEEKTSISTKFQHIEIVFIRRIQSSYDTMGHTMYIHYFRQHIDKMLQYRYFWIIENDVYYPNSLLEFTENHEKYNYDLLVSNYSVRPLNWCWTRSLAGFRSVRNVGIFAFIMRFSVRLLCILIDTIDRVHSGYLEAVLPHICIEYDLTIQQFLPELCGILTTDNADPCVKLIRDDIQNRTNVAIENKIYHPVKL